MPVIEFMIFASAAEALGGTSLKVELENDKPTVGDLVSYLKTNHPSEQKVIESCRVAVNQELVSNDSIIPANAEVALLPPSSGG